MKSILIIGMGRFGHYLCDGFLEQGDQVMVVDKNEAALEDVMHRVTSALIADCTKEDNLKRLGAADFDICFVCIADDFQSSLEITSLLKDMGASHVVSLSKREIHTKFLLRNGADEVIHPDKDIALRSAIEYSNDNIFDYIELDGGYSIYEISPARGWIGKSLRENDIRAKHKISVIALKNADGELDITPDPDRPIKPDEHMMIIARKEDVDAITK